MKTETPALPAPPPQIVDGRTSPSNIVRNVRIVDAVTGDEIAKVVSADADAGRISRYEIDGDGNLVRENDKFKIVDEDRAIRIEWIRLPEGDVAYDVDDVDAG